MLRGMKKQISLGSLALAAVAALTLSACSENKPPPSAEDTAKMKAYADCMRPYGFNVPVPGEEEPAGGLFTFNPSDPKALAAKSACARLEPGAHIQGKMDPAEEERVLKLAQCLRSEGIKAKDPGPGQMTVTLEDGVTYTQQQLVDAYTTCNQQVPAVKK
jgi:hypothetical protein